MSIAFTQFMLPMGKRVRTTFEASREVEALADELIAAGYRFECEVLRTGHVHIDCCGPALDGTGGDGPLALEVCENGPPVVAAVETVVRVAHEAWKGVVRP